MDFLFFYDGFLGEFYPFKCLLANGYIVEKWYRQRIFW